MGSVLNSTYSSHLDVSGLSAGQANAAGDSIAGTLGLAGRLGARGDNLVARAQGAVVDGLHAALWLGVGVLALATLVLLLLGPRRSEIEFEEDPLEPATPVTETASVDANRVARPVAAPVVNR